MVSTCSFNDVFRVAGFFRRQGRHEAERKQPYQCSGICSLLNRAKIRGQRLRRNTEQIRRGQRKYRGIESVSWRSACLRYRSKVRFWLRREWWDVLTGDCCRWAWKIGGNDDGDIGCNGRRCVCDKRGWGAGGFNFYNGESDVAGNRLYAQRWRANQRQVWLRGVRGCDKRSRSCQCLQRGGSRFHQSIHYIIQGGKMSPDASSENFAGT